MERCSRYIKRVDLQFSRSQNGTEPRYGVNLKRFLISSSRYELYISLHLRMLVRIMTYFGKLVSLYYYSAKLENGMTRPRPLHKYPDIY